mgnify:CR=1 FL=1
MNSTNYTAYPNDNFIDYNHHYNYNSFLLLFHDYGTHDIKTCKLKLILNQVKLLQDHLDI